jgi:integrase-like protein
LPPIFYTDHSASAEIATQTSLKSVSVDKLNLRLIRASQYLQQFRLRVFHRPGKTNAIADALSRLQAKKTSDTNLMDLDALHANAYTATLVELSDDFRAKLLDGYTKDTRWSKVMNILKSSEESDDPMKAVLPYFLERDLLYTTGTSSTERKLCIPRSLVPEIFELAHDSAGHQGFNRSYERLAGLAIYKGSRLLRQYIAACPQCNQFSTKRHRRIATTDNTATHTLSHHHYRHYNGPTKVKRWKGPSSHHYR